MGWDIKREGSLLIISVVWTLVVYILITFVKKFIRSLPPGRRLVTSDIQVKDGNQKFSLASGSISTYIAWGDLAILKRMNFRKSSKRPWTNFGGGS